VLRLLALLHVLAIAIAISVATNCGGDEAVEAPRTSAPDTATIRPTVRTETPVPTATLNVAGCDSPPRADERYRVVAQDEGAQDYVGGVEAALTGAIEHAGSVYGWTPVEPVCVHLFSSDETFIQGLQLTGGLSANFAATFSEYGGTTGVDLHTNRDAIFLNVSDVRSVPFLTTHEYLHIVQYYVEHGGAHIWFLEGISEWEAGRLHGNPDPQWLSSFVALARLGQVPELSRLVNQHQWIEVEDSFAAYAKVRLALMYLETIAGPNAAPALLGDENVTDFVDFEPAFRALTGLTIDEFDDQLLPFAEGLIAESN
jgi:hypothetical protein